MAQYGLADLPNMKILDIGCGNGRMLRRLCDMGARPENCVGVDISEKAIEYARENSPRDIYFYHADFINANFMPEHFDLVICFGVVIHIMENSYVKLMADKIKQMLKPNGLLMVSYSTEINWNEEMAKITRNYKHEQIEGFFAWDGNMEYLGQKPVYYDNYRYDVPLGLIMQAIDCSIATTDYHMAIFKRK